MGLTSPPGSTDDFRKVGLWFESAFAARVGDLPVPAGLSLFRQAPPCSACDISLFCMRRLPVQRRLFSLLICRPSSRRLKKL